MPSHSKFAALALSIALPVRAHAQTIQGTLFEDVNRNGVRDFGEPALSGIPVTLFGDGGAVDVQTASAADGTWSFTVASGLEFVLDVEPGADWRESFQDLGADADPIPDWPQGRRRPGATGFLVGNLRAATTGAPLLHVALGDSIAYGFNLCDSTSGQNDYVTPLTDRLGRASAKATLTKLAVLGQETKDLLATSGTGTIHDAISAGAQLVSISIGGNDYLNDDGNTAATAANLVGARQNLQEILSTLESELPGSDVVLNTVYDNKGGSNAFHNTWGPIWDQALRDVAWGQVRRVCIAEIFPDYVHLDPGTNTVLGETGLICSFFGLDGIHPKKRGYDLHEQKVSRGCRRSRPTSSAARRTSPTRSRRTTSARRFRAATRRSGCRASTPRRTGSSSRSSCTSATARALRRPTTSTASRRRWTGPSRRRAPTRRAGTRSSRSSAAPASERRSSRVPTSRAGATSRRS